MVNATATVTRRLSDPDFQGSLVTKCLGLTIVMAIALSMSMGYIAFMWANPAKPTYFISDGKGFTRPVQPVDVPIVDDTELLSWATKAVIAPYNLDYYNYAPELNAASRRFTVRGWNTFANSFITQGNFDELKRAQMLCHAQPTRAALPHAAGFSQGALAIEIEVPIIQTCENVNQTSTNNLLIKALVVRTNESAHPDGLAIDRLIATKY